MHHKKESLKNLLEISEYYKDIIDLGPPKKSTLIRYVISNWQYYERKKELARLGANKVKYSRKSGEFWDMYLSLSSIDNSRRNRHHNI